MSFYVPILSIFQSVIKKSARKRDFTFKNVLRRQMLCCSGNAAKWMTFNKQGGGGENAFYGSRVSACSARKQISSEGTILPLYSSSNYLYKLEGKVITRQISPNRAGFLNGTLHWQINRHGVRSERPVCRLKSKPGCMHVLVCNVLTQGSKETVTIVSR